MAKICPNCEKENPSYVQYCAFCGTQIVDDVLLSEEDKLRKKLAEQKQKIDLLIHAEKLEKEKLEKELLESQLELEKEKSEKRKLYEKIETEDRIIDSDEKVNFDNSSEKYSQSTSDKDPEIEQSTQSEGISKKGKKNLIFLSIIAILLILLGLIFFFNDNSRESSSTIPLDDAKSMYNALQQTIRDADFERLNNLFDDEVIKYYRFENVSKNKIIEDERKYLVKWQPIDAQIISFSKNSSGENLFDYSVLYTVKSRISGIVIKYDIKGTIGFVKKDDLFKINFINDIETNKIEQTLSVRKLKFEKSTKSRYGVDIDFVRELLIFSDISDGNTLNYLYDGVVSKNNFVGKDYDFFYNAVENDFNVYYEENKNRDLENNEYEVADAYQMSVKYCSQSYLVVNILIEANLGGGAGSSYINSNLSRIINLSNGKIVKNEDILDTSKITDAMWIDYFNNYSGLQEDDLGSIDGFASYESKMHNVFFDEKNVYIIFQQYSIGPGYLGEIRLGIPYSKIKKALKPEFMKNIENAQPVQIVEI